MASPFTFHHKKFLTTQPMSSYFMGISRRPYVCTSTEGDRMEILADTHASALYTAAELFDLPVTHVYAFATEMWDDVHSHQGR